MAVLEFVTEADALAVPDPKHIWATGRIWVVYTEGDIPVDVTPEPPADLGDFTQAGSGAYPQPIAKKLSRSIHVYDFMTDAQRADFESGSPALNHSDAITRAITAGATTKKEVIASGGRYNVDTDVSILSGVDFSGHGAKTEFNLRGGKLKLTPPSGAGNRHGAVARFNVLGNGGAVGMQLSLVTFRDFEQIRIFDCVTGLLVDATQNCIFDGLHLYDCQDGLTLVNGVGNCVFRRIESETMTRYAIYLASADASLPGHAYNIYSRMNRNNTFERSITEYSNTAIYNLYIQAGINNAFRDVDFGTTTHTTVMIDAGSNLNKFYNPSFNGGGGTHAAIVNYGYGTVIEDPIVENFQPNTEVIQTYARTIVRQEHFGGASYQIKNKTGSAGNNVIKNDSVFLDTATVTSSNKSRLPGNMLFDNKHRVWHAGVDEALQLVTGVTERISVTTTAGTSHSATLQLQSAGAYTLTARLADADGSNARDAVWLVSWSGASATAQKLGSDNVIGAAVTALSASVDGAGLVTISGTTGSAIAGSLSAKAVGASS